MGMNNSLYEQEDHERTSEDNIESIPSTFIDTKMTSISSPRKRRAMQKKVISFPIKNIEGSRIKSDTAPPSDSWAWRKYGQKPIKGSPYPRGYYRCSSSKGCPARKQVERSHVDPTTMVVTYSGEHNHSWPPASRNQNNHRVSTAAAPATAEEPESLKLDPKIEPEEKFEDLGSGEFSWFGEMETATTSRVFESPIFAESCRRDDEVAMHFPMKEEDEFLFADLGELPECSTVLRQIGVGPQVQIC